MWMMMDVSVSWAMFLVLVPIRGWFSILFSGVRGFGATFFVGLATWLYATHRVHTKIHGFRILSLRKSNNWSEKHQKVGVSATPHCITRSETAWSSYALPTCFCVQQDCWSAKSYCIVQATNRFRRQSLPGMGWEDPCQLLGGYYFFSRSDFHICSSPSWIRRAMQPSVTRKGSCVQTVVSRVSGAVWCPVNIF